MTERKVCANCVFFLKRDGDAANDGDLPPGGQCLRYPPVPMLINQQSIMGGQTAGMAGIFPPVNADSTCGEFYAHGLGELLLRNPTKERPHGDLDPGADGE